jgi:aryl-alcohol dehydrogenase-like predicted oxidoreductase
MRSIFIPALDRSVSVVGFGCASLGSRVSAKEGLIALERAYDKGVTWYDVAPPYGDGHAEGLLGRFLAGKRDQVAVCTKVGIKPPQVSPVMRFAKPLLRAALGVAPQLRRRVARGRPTSTRVKITPSEIASSVEASLRRLGVDHVDVLALHDPSPETVLNDEIAEAMEKIVQKGQAKVVGIAGDKSVGDQGIARLPTYRMVQHASAFGEPKAEHLSSKGVFRVVHSVFGVAGSLEALIQRIDMDAELKRSLEALGLDGDSRALASKALLDYALANNMTGVVLTSMFKPAHMDFNCGRAERAPRADIVPILDRAMFTGQ